jgi:esterase/lipase superfamily enzyme
MANKQHIEWLLEGVAKWNARRKKTPFTPDLSGADIYKVFKSNNALKPDGYIPLRGINLSNADLTDANLNFADLRYSDLRDANLTGANLKHAMSYRARTVSKHTPAPPTEAMIEPEFSSTSTDSFLESEPQIARSSRPTRPRPVAKSSAPRPSAKRSPTPIKRSKSLSYPVWYGTNRKPNSRKDISQGYTGKSDIKGMHYGKVYVEIPKAHKIGSTGSKWWKRVFTGDDRLKITNITESSKTDFWADVKKTIAAPKTGKSAFMFIHGFNISFEEAATRAAQIGVDMSGDAMTCIYSWPSRNKLLKYKQDEATAEASDSHLAKFIKEFLQKSDVKHLHIMAHSMGGRVLRRALETLNASLSKADRKKIGHIIFAASDVDQNDMYKSANAINELGLSRTIYVSRGDLAVELSRWVHNGSRVGICPPVFINTKMTTIEATNVKVTALGHTYVSGSKALLTDMHNLIFKGMKQTPRRGMTKNTYKGKVFWEFK